MAQQTRVGVVIPYFEAFLLRWPTLAELAAASEEEVLRSWAGLGYYSRARNLLRCAQRAQAAGGLPRTAAQLVELPGIGPYTAAAVASIAFGESVGLVDGNVQRVLSRLDGRTAEPTSAAGRAALWTRADALQEARPDGSHPGDLNQALMELGALVCVPRQPRCGACPVAEMCRAVAMGDPEALPARRSTREPAPIRAVSGLLVFDEGVVLGRRPAGLLGGMWEPIGVELSASDPPQEALQRAFAERAGLRVSVDALRGQVVHVFTHRRLTCAVYAVSHQSGVLRRGEWYTHVRALRDPEDVALSTLSRRILDLV